MSDFDLAIQLLPLQLGNTLYLVFTSACIAILLGLPLGLWLTSSAKSHRLLYKILSLGVNMGRSFPFAILMVTLIPFTRILVGTSLGTTAAIVPLSIAAIPFVARLIETALREVDPQLSEAARVMGSTEWQILTKVLLPEALPSIYAGITLTLINLVSYSTMAGLVGGGGLGQIAIQYGYHRYNTGIMVTTVILLILLVQSIQWAGNCLVQSILKKRGILS